MPHSTAPTTPFAQLDAAERTALLAQQCQEYPSPLCSGNGNCTIAAFTSNHTLANANNSTSGLVATATDLHNDTLCTCISGWSGDFCQFQKLKTSETFKPEWVWAPIVSVVGVVLLAVLVYFLVRYWKQRRESTATYSPGKEEAIRPRLDMIVTSTNTSGTFRQIDFLKPPPVERLI